jgi:D-glutamate N-acetyltransferase
MSSVRTAKAIEDGERSSEPRVVLPAPYLLFLGDTTEPGFAKTAFGLRDWAPERCVGEYALPGATVTTGLPPLTPAEAVRAGARSLVIGVANSGGFIGEAWIPALLDALQSGLDLVSGLHARLANVPELRGAAERLGRRLIDVRVPPADIPIGTGIKRRGKRLLTVGTDCALGKKYAALALAGVFQARGVDCDFRATGQTGIIIAGSGIPMDAVVSDFAAGAAELLSPDASDDHWDVIEGQGSILHPAYAGVSLALLHGSQPDRFVVCHDPARTRLLGDEAFAVPSVEEIIEVTVRLGSRTNPAIRCSGLCLNTSKMDAEAAVELIESESARLGLPAADPIRGGPAFERLVDHCLA